VRLRHLYTGELTWRELGVLVRGLPPTSRLRAAMAGGQPQWSMSDYLLAGAVDALVAANWQRANSGSKSPSPRPKPIPRPAPPAVGTAIAAVPDREAARQAAVARAHAHRDAVAAGHIT
jgi:hypothetical protein